MFEQDNSFNGSFVIIYVQQNIFFLITENSEVKRMRAELVILLILLITGRDVFDMKTSFKSLIRCSMTTSDSLQL